MNSDQRDQPESEAPDHVILIIDNDPNALEIVSGYLEECHYTVLIAEDGESGLKRAQYVCPDLILLDIMMPGIDGYETCFRLKELERTRDIPVIFMTALADTDHKVRGFEAGAVDYVTKPIHREEVVARVGVHLHIRELTSRLRKANELLEQRIRERTAELRNNNEKLALELAERRRAEEALKQIEWMLSKKPSSSEDQADAAYDQGYGDLTLLNRGGLISRSVDRRVLRGIASEYLDLLDTSSAIYEINGDYAFGIFSSRWCRLLDRSSRKLCHTDDNAQALASGKWLCHESCWTTCSKQAIDTKAPSDIECNGGIRIYGVPIFADEEVIGAINFGYGTPPKEPEKLRLLAESYAVDIEELLQEALSYNTRPSFIIEVAKQRLQVSARLIGMLVERYRVEEALRESETKYHRIVDTATEGIWVLGPDTGTTFVNARMAEMLGYSDKEMIGRSMADFMFEEDAPDHLRTMENRRQGLVENYERRFLRKDGRTVCTLVSAAPIFDANHTFLGSFAMFTDITERKRAEDEVRHLKNYLANIIDSMPSLLAGMDCEGGITQWNQHAEKTTGIPVAEAIGRHVSQVLPDYAPWIEAMRGEAGQGRPASLEKLLIEKEGERHFYDLMLYPLITNGMEGTVLRIEDVTERSRIQELMIQTEKMISVGGLAAGMAHEINNPLGIITQAAQNIERRVSPELSANRIEAAASGVSLEAMQTYFVRRQIPEFIASIREAASRATRIITNILRFSRRSETAIQPASLAGVMEQALELAANDYDLKKKYDFRSIAIVRDYQPDMPDLPVMATEIEQVLLNLLKNAAQAMIVNPAERPPQIVLRIRRQDRYAVLEVEDNGPGMTEEIRRRVFEPFFTTKEPGIGTGLGLSVSYMIVTQNHKGLMEVASLPGNGACFTVRLPLNGRVGQAVSRSGSRDND